MLSEETIPSSPLYKGGVTPILFLPLIEPVPYKRSTHYPSPYGRGVEFVNEHERIYKFG